VKEKSTGNTVLIVDGGGRGSALVDKYAQSEHVGRIIAVPGNDLMKNLTDKPVQIFLN
jgi:phosphoribosylamine-glycine ligase